MIIEIQTLIFSVRKIQNEFRKNFQKYSDKILNFCFMGVFFMLSALRAESIIYTLGMCMSLQSFGLSISVTTKILLA